MNEDLHPLNMAIKLAVTILVKRAAGIQWPDGKIKSTAKNSLKDEHTIKVNSEKWQELSGKHSLQGTRL